MEEEQSRMKFIVSVAPPGACPVRNDGDAWYPIGNVVRKSMLLNPRPPQGRGGVVGGELWPRRCDQI